MDLGIKGKIALVTAATKGLGRGSAEALAAEGCRVVICSRTAADVERAVGELSDKHGTEVVGFTADMSQAGDIDALLDGVRDKLGDPEIVVCNAGGPPPGNFASTGIDKFIPAVELSMMSSIRLTYGTMEGMKAKGWGRIVYITSVSVKQPIPYILLSNTARAGLTGFMKTVAREVAPTGVTINAVLPGAHETDRIRQTVRMEAEKKGISMEEELKNRAQEVPTKTIGDAGDFGGVVAFLCSRQANFITGENILVDGGAYAGLV